MEDGRPSKVRTRVMLGCQACRIRHVKCDDAIPSCTACAVDGIQCVRPSSIRFKDDASQGDPKQLFNENQVWVGTEGDITFCDETVQIRKLYKQAAEDGSVSNQRPPVPDPVSFPESTGIDLYGDVTVPDRSPSDHRTHALGLSQSSFHIDSHASPALSSRPHHEPPYSQGTPLTSTPHRYYPSLASLLSAENHAVPYTEREAILMRNYIDNMALWADITDPDRHFETEVPRRALFHPVLRYAIFAFSSQHMHRNVQSEDAEALEYYTKCLNILIPALASAGSRVPEEVHAAVSVLRQYEEMDSQDEQFHLAGTTQIVNSMHSLDFTRGLSEASAWLCLRQDIYISIARQTPLRTSLSAFGESETFHRREDTSYAARMVFLLAKLVACAHSEDSSSKPERLDAVSKEIEEWYADRPLTFVPIRQTPSDASSGRTFPDIWMSLPCQVVALQYYHIAKIVLLLSEQKAQKPGMAGLREGRKVENTIRGHLRHVVGLAISNPRAQNTLFSARHALEVWGSVFYDKPDQAAVEEFLALVQETTGWRTAPMLASLRSQWAED
ncbi:putative Zn(2)-C6 fungal-type domain-containing protein [Seiridium cardinale]